MKKLIWYLKQIFPLKYDTTFTENNLRKLCIWRMWLGRCCNARYFELKEVA